MRSDSLFGNARRARFQVGAGPLPHPATHGSVLSLGGRVGERAGADLKLRASRSFQTNSERGRVRAIWLGLAGLIAALAASNAALEWGGARAAAGFVPVCSACHDGLLVPVPAR